MRALNTAADLGFDVDSLARGYIRWQLARLDTGSSFHRYCRGGDSAWSACGAADADDAALALWIELLLRTAGRSPMPAAWRRSADLSWRALASLWDPVVGVYVVASAVRTGLLMDNIEVLSALETAARARRSADTDRVRLSRGAARLRSAITRVFWDQETARYRVSTQPPELNPRFYPEIVAQVFPAAFGYGDPRGSAKALVTQWLRQHEREWVAASDSGAGVGVGGGRRPAHRPRRSGRLLARPCRGSTIRHRLERDRRGHLCHPEQSEGRRPLLRRQRKANPFVLMDIVGVPPGPLNFTVMSSLPITSVFNDGYVAEQFDSFQRDPRRSTSLGVSSSASPSSLAGTDSYASGVDRRSLLRKTAAPPRSSTPFRIRPPRLSSSIRSAQRHRAPRSFEAGIPRHHRTRSRPMCRRQGARLRDGTAADVVRRCASLLQRDRDTSSSTWASEERAANGSARHRRGRDRDAPLTTDEKKTPAQRLTEVDGLERFLGRAYVSVKRFSIEGVDASSRCSTKRSTRAPRSGAQHVVIGMAHRGRMNVLTHVMGKSYASCSTSSKGRHGDEAPTATAAT